MLLVNYGAKLQQDEGQNPQRAGTRSFRALQPKLAPRSGSSIGAHSFLPKTCALTASDDLVSNRVSNPLHRTTFSLRDLIEENQAVSAARIVPRSVVYIPW
jgi:hypothetical protein